MAEQLTFNLPVRAALGREAFLVAPSNALAVARIDGWRNWPGRALILCGPEGCGKTHLAHAWARDTGAEFVTTASLPGADLPAIVSRRFIVVEDCQQVVGQPLAEVALFHLYNMARTQGAWLLLTARTPPATWPDILADLKSRLQALDLVHIQPPDDDLLAGLLVKLFADRQINVTPDLISYLVSRMERSAAAARDLVARLDQAALALNRPLGKRLARQVLDESGQLEA